MSESPKVSVCIPSYNHARFLPAAIDSVLAQTHKNLEVTIVDDGSTDDSLEIARDYAARHPRIIRVFTHPGHKNRGTSATVNLAFQHATGVYWCGLPSDDLLHPRKIAEQVEFLERHPEIGWVYSHAYVVDENGRRRSEFGLASDDITRESDVVERLILGNPVCGMTVMMRRDLVAELAPHDEALVYSDWDFWARMAAKYRAAFQPRARVLFRMHGYNTSFGIKVETNFQHSLAVILKLRRETREPGPLSRPRTQSLLALQSSYYCYCLRNEAQAQKHLAAAFEADPSLQADPEYFVRWLRYRYRVLVLIPGGLTYFGFAQWALAHLPAGLNERFIQYVTKRVAGRAFQPGAAKYYLIRTHLQTRRKLLRSMFSDSLVWRERDLFALHVESLVGSRVRKWLHRHLPGRSHAAANLD